MGIQEGANEDNPPLVMALHLETLSSIFNLAAHGLLRNLIEHPPIAEELPLVRGTLQKQLFSNS